ncbi:MAG TPA: 3-oxoadipate enol-lactonase [Steroidobacteraceae bacterium]|nr:3-oxoadipate enol-lactonase [Steroidobacteraceae bacterium]
MPQLQANGCEFHVAVDGPVDAPCLVLSNSLGSSLEMWAPQVDAFARHRRVLRYDTRGHGRSAVTRGPYSIELLAEDVLRLLDAAGIERADFCGLSMGGATGIWLAAHAPERFDRFVFCNTVPWLGAADAMLARAAIVRRDGLGGLVDATMERWFTAEFREREPRTVAAVRASFLATPPEGYAACCEALAGFDERDMLAAIERPVLVVAGLQDPAPPLEAAREYAAKITGARIVELPAAHLSNLGAAARFNAEVLNFLGDRSLAQAT